jgi:hypothetical protein
MRSFHWLIAFLLTASTALADPVITSVTPNTGPVSGGTTVVIRGAEFSEGCVICSPPLPGSAVFFDGTPATDVFFIDSTTLEAVTPAHVPESVVVTVLQPDGSFARLVNGFTYEGDVYDAYDPLLFPIFTPPVFGQGGSEFRTTAKFWNKGDQPVSFFGFDSSCLVIADPLSVPLNPYTLQPHQEQALNLFPECSQTTGKLFYVLKGERGLAGSLRVWEVSKQGSNHGVEIPVVRLEDFDEESIALVSVPTDPKFRLTLRVYGLNPGPAFVNVSYGGKVVQLPMQSSSNIYEPGYAVYTGFTPPPGGHVPTPPFMNVLVEVPRGPDGAVIPGTPIWAFITVTNNETQHITTVTPQQ